MAHSSACHGAISDLIRQSSELELLCMLCSNESSSSAHSRATEHRFTSKANDIATCLTRSLHELSELMIVCSASSMRVWLFNTVTAHQRVRIPQSQSVVHLVSANTCALIVIHFLRIHQHTENAPLWDPSLLSTVMVALR